MSSTIFALAICLFNADPNFQKANGCTFPENGMTYFYTAEECQRVADNANKGYASNQTRTLKRTVVCYRRSISKGWEPTIDVEVRPPASYAVPADAAYPSDPDPNYGVKDEASCRPLVIKGFDEYAKRTRRQFTAKDRETLIELRVEVCMRDGFSKYLQ